MGDLQDYLSMLVKKFCNVFCFVLFSLFLNFLCVCCCKGERNASSSGRGGVRWWIAFLSITTFVDCFHVFSIGYFPFVLYWVFSLRSTLGLVLPCIICSSILCCRVFSFLFSFSIWIFPYLAGCSSTYI